MDTLYSGHLGTGKDCPDYECVLISGAEAVLCQSTRSEAPVACVLRLSPYISSVWIRGFTVYVCIYSQLVYNDTLGATKMCCCNQVVVVTRTFSTETIESVPAMCVVVKRLML